jgi:hypothetical protein
MFVCCECCVFVRQMSLLRADHSSRGVLPTVSCHCVWSQNLKNEEAKTRKWVVKASKRIKRNINKSNKQAFSNFKMHVSNVKITSSDEALVFGMYKNYFGCHLAWFRVCDFLQWLRISTKTFSRNRPRLFPLTSFPLRGRLIVIRPQLIWFRVRRSTHWTGRETCKFQI